MLSDHVDPMCDKIDSTANYRTKKWECGIAASRTMHARHIALLKKYSHRSHEAYLNELRYA